MGFLTLCCHGNLDLLRVLFWAPRGGFWIPRRHYVLGTVCREPTGYSYRIAMSNHLLQCVIFRYAISLLKTCCLSFSLPSFLFFFFFKTFSKQAVEHVQSHLSKKQVTATLFQVRWLQNKRLWPASHSDLIRFPRLAELMPWRSSQNAGVLLLHPAALLTGFADVPGKGLMQPSCNCMFWKSIEPRQDRVFLLFGVWCL